MLGKLLLTAAVVLAAIHGSGAQGCGGNLNAPPGGTVVSPNYPENYNNNDLCNWRITAPVGCTIRLTFTVFDIERWADYLFIFDGGSAAAPQIAKLDGYVLPADITSTSNQLFVRFESDFSIVYTGFSFTYEAHCENVIPCAADIVLVLDLSSSIPQDQFELARDFMVAFVDCEAFQEKDIRIAAINYTCEADTYFDLAPIDMGMSYEIEQLTRGDGGGETRTGHAIYHMRYTSKFGADAHHTAVILTDGQSDDDAIAEAGDARDMGITLYAVGFGDARLVDPAALADMTGSNDRVFDASQACDLAQKILFDQCGIRICPEDNRIVLPSGKTYIVPEFSSTYEDAQEECRRQGGIVAIPRDEEEQLNVVFLKNCVSRTAQFWVGVKKTAGLWMDDRGTALGSFTSWAPTEPNDGSGCALFVFGDGRRRRADKWADTLCSEQFRYVCEIQNVII